ncbi:MAG: hypothetical protein LBU89_10935 [Fibromonadaceae bacterium]|jgi:hypothetical protein|nr:hypothetical protein [Fibromonadaceae bacterium]
MATNFTIVPLTYAAAPGMEKADSIELATAWGNNAAPVFNSDGTSSDSTFLRTDTGSKKVVKGFPYELSFKHGLSTLGKTLLIP